MGMRAALKSIDLNSACEFDGFIPDDPVAFSVWLTASIGPVASEGAELFQLQVCTPEYVRRELLQPGFVWGRHMLLVDRFDPKLIRQALAAYVDRCSGTDWPEVAEQVARIAHWEFEDYRPHPEETL